MIERREELGYVECDHASVILSEPPCSYDVREVKARVSRRSLSDTAQLAGVQETINGHVELQARANDFLYEFPGSVKQDNGVEGLRCII